MIRSSRADLASLQQDNAALAAIRANADNRALSGRPARELFHGLAPAANQILGVICIVTPISAGAAR
jgi:hypothetical protein